MERPLTDAFFPDRNVGVMLSNTLAEKRMLWQVATFRDTNDVGQAFSSFSSTDWDAVARVTGLPIWADDGAHLLHLGFDYLHRFRGQSVSFSQRPESFLADNFVNTASINANGTNVFDVELAYVRGPLAIQSEYTNALVDGDQNQDNLDFWGVYGQVSYFLTGEHKAYEQDYGCFGRIRPKNNFNPAEGGWGAWEIAARVSYLDLDDENVNGGKLLDVLAGINWYLFPNARIMLNYIHAHLTDRRAPAPAFSMGGRGNILQTRFQIGFEPRAVATAGRSRAGSAPSPFAAGGRPVGMGKSRPARVIPLAPGSRGRAKADRLRRRRHRRRTSAVRLLGP